MNVSFSESDFLGFRDLANSEDTLTLTPEQYFTGDLVNDGPVFVQLNNVTSTVEPFLSSFLVEFQPNADLFFRNSGNFPDFSDFIEGLNDGDSITYNFTVFTAQGNGFSFDLIIEGETNTIPVVANDDTFMISESQVLSGIDNQGFFLIGFSEFLGNDSGTDLEILTVDIASNPLLQPNTGNANGIAFELFIGTREEIENLDDGNQITLNYTYLIQDPSGEQDSGNFTLIIEGESPVNQPPILQDDTVSIPFESSTVIVDVLANDTDPDGDTLSVIEISSIPPNTVTAAIAPNNQGVEITPEPGFFGDVTVPLVVNDGENSTFSNLFVTVDPPEFTAVNDTFTFTESEAIANIASNFGLLGIDPNDLLANDVGTDLQVLSVNPGSLGTNAAFLQGNIALAIFSFNIEPLNDGDTYTETFTYRVEDVADQQQTAEFTIVINGEGQLTPPPIATDDSFTLTESDAIAQLDDFGQITLSGVLDNDSGADISLTNVGSQNGDALVPLNGANNTILLFDDGGAESTIEALNDGETYVQTLTYTIEDGIGQTDTGAITITITGEDPPNSAPIATDDAAVTPFETPVTVDVLANDSDPENDVLSITEATADNGAIATIDGDSITVEPAPEFEGNLSVTYTISDGELTDTAVLTVTVEPEPITPAPSGDYVIFDRAGFTVSIAGGSLVFSDGSTDVDGFLDNAIASFGGVQARNGSVSDRTLEHFGPQSNPGIFVDNQGRLTIGGSGVGGSQRYSFDESGDLAGAIAFARDLLGRDPRLTRVFEFSGSTNGGANRIRVHTNDEIIGLNGGVPDGLLTTDSIQYSWSGADTPGTQSRNTQNAFISSMGTLWGGNRTSNTDLNTIGGLEIETIGSTVQIGGSGIEGLETWEFSSDAKAGNFAGFLTDINAIAF